MTPPAPAPAPAFAAPRPIHDGASVDAKPAATSPVVSPGTSPSQDRGHTLDLPLQQPSSSFTPAPRPSVVETRTEPAMTSPPKDPAVDANTKKENAVDAKPVDRESDSAA
jgi:hypothetical protein